MFEIVIVLIVVISILKKVSRDSKTGSKDKTTNKRYSTVNSHYSMETIKPELKKVYEKAQSGVQSIASTFPREKAVSVARELIKIDKEPASSVLKDDKKHDWLAYQLAEERKAYRKTKSMFDHDIAFEHSKRCDADGIDDGLSD